MGIRSPCQYSGNWFAKGCRAQLTDIILYKPLLVGKNECLSWMTFIVFPLFLFHHIAAGHDTLTHTMGDQVCLHNLQTQTPAPSRPRPLYDLICIYIYIDTFDSCIFFSIYN